MNSADFAQFYSAIHGDPESPGKLRKPFPWQQRLVDRLLEGGAWPNAIAVPTASGKTSVLDAAVFVLASQSAARQSDRFSRRIFFVVDRRLVVDDVTLHAQKIASKLLAPDTPILEEASANLLQYGGEIPLAVGTLRGGMYRSSQWTESPQQPLICVSTVDQIGSRLLFRGYGLRAERRPIDAAFVANDSLIFLDEAHLSNPFLQTARGVAELQREWAGAGGVMNVVEMSATTRSAAETTVRLEEDDYEDPELKRRLVAIKDADLKETSRIVDEAEAAAFELQKSFPIIGIVVNTVRTAREIFERIRKKAGDEGSLLLTGRIRPYDRDELMKRYAHRIKAWRNYSQNDRLTVVATQTVEVGADIDFDALITEAAPLDSLRQRFGRLNRLGRLERSSALILKPGKEKEGSIYGVATENTWNWLIKHAKANKSGKSIDFGARAMGQLFTQEGDDSLLPQLGRAPLLTRTLVSDWACTNPVPHPDADIPPFLHGAKALEAADVQIVWRHDLAQLSLEPSEAEAEEWIEALSLLPPQSRESLPMPLWQARRWLEGMDASVMDIESGDTPTSEQTSNGKPFLVWRGPEKSFIPPNSDWLHPGDTIVVPTIYGGTDCYGWNSGVAASDVADECSLERSGAQGGRRAVRRNVKQLCESGGIDSSAVEREDVRQLVRESITGKWKFDFYGPLNADTGLPGWIIGFQSVPRLKRARVAAGDRDEAIEDDNASLTAQVSLADHTKRVIRLATAFAASCGIDSVPMAAIRIAAELHDLGKADQRFQQLLAPAGSTKGILAKGEQPGSSQEYLRRLQDSGYPRYARHEFASLALAEQYGQWPGEDIKDLGLYLIGTHHGYGRPIAPVWIEDGKDSIASDQHGLLIAPTDAVAYGRFGSGWTERYHRLTTRYGWWQLAYFEAILRLADCEASRQEAELALESITKQAFEVLDA